MRSYDAADPFYGCFESKLPQPTGIAAKWFWLKAQVGNCHPGAARPFGMVSACAYTGGYSSGYGPYWINSNALPPRLMEPDAMKALGVSHFQQSGTGYIDEFYNYCIVTPCENGVLPRYARLALGAEKAVPGYYACDLGSTKTELTVTKRAAAERFSFSGERGTLVFDLLLNGLVKGSAPLAPLGKLVSLHFLNDGFDCVSDYTLRLYVSVRCEKAENIRALPDGRAAFDTGKTADVFLGFSFSSAEKAARNCLEAQKKGFENTRAEARAAWEERLDAIQIDAGDGFKKLFYSNYYQSLIKPVFLGDDSPHTHGGVTVGAADFATMWDQYKTALPLLFTLFSDVGEKIAGAFIDSVCVFGEMPSGLLLTNPDARCSSQSRGLMSLSLYDAYLRGIKVDPKEALWAIDRELNLPENAEFREKGAADEYPSHTLDLASAAFAAFLLAKECGDEKGEARYLRYSKAWMNAYDPKTGLCRADGKFYEGSAANYSFRLLPFMKERFAFCDGVRLLDRFFGYGLADAVPFTDPGDAEKLRGGEAREVFEGFNNETDMEAPYAYLYLGRPDRTAEIVRGGTRQLYKNGRNGLPGNNDSGGLSSLFVMNALGVFPAAGQDVILLGSPSVQSASLRLASGETLRIETDGNSEENIYPKAILWNGQRLNTPFLSVREFMRGGELRFLMGAQPEKWG